ncbi:MAG TPA: VanW family protein, partial [Acidimicrobiales bacterium]|nr:VanW family protein [Acidimicrobiales bacterium]
PPAYGAHREPGPIFDLPDSGDGGNGPERPRVLGGAAAAEGRTTGQTSRIGGPATATRPGTPPGGNHGLGTLPHAGAGPAGATANGGRHFGPNGAPNGGALTRRPPWFYLAIGIPVALLVVLILGWAVDSAALSGQVMRNVEVGDKPVGGLGEASLPGVMDGLNKSLVARPVEIKAGDKTYRTTAGALGLTVDEDATAKAALDAGRGDSLVIRPFTWATSFFHHRKVDLRYAVKQSQVESTMLVLQGTDLTAGKPPTITLGAQGWTAIPGVPGRGVDVDRIGDRLPQAAADSPDGTIVVRTRTIPVTAGYTDEDAKRLAERANQITANGLALKAGGTTVNVPTATLRTWIAPVAAQDHLDLALKTDTVKAALPQLFHGITKQPVDAGFTLVNGVPTVIPSRDGVGCCGPDSADLVWKALTQGQPAAELKAQVVQPRLTTAKAKALGIRQPVGGNHAWRDGAPTTAGPGFTTYYQPGMPRVTNIHRIADLVRGSVVLPGETFSVNGRVGERTTAKGFVVAGAIREGEHVDEVGGGVSQFATTTFNAAYFAGLDITTYQAHSEWFTRYPRGREATMGFPAPDLKFKNNTPYGILVWTSFTGNSVTVTLYSTPYATADQTGISESTAGACKVVTTTRTITYPGGRKDTDTFKATYRPSEDVTHC